jgi:DNA-binding beta-propeller fold protein YncE
VSVRAGRGLLRCRRLRAIFAVALAIAAFLVLTPLAQAESTTHPFLEEFGSASQPTFTSAAGIAVDQSTGDVLVIDESAQTLNRFHADGTPDNFAELGGNVIDGHAGGADATPNGQILGNFGGANEVQVAIDNSGTATGGDIYVTDESHNIIDVFNSEGKYLGQLTAAGASAFGETCGVAVDEAGNVYVGDYNHGVHKFEPSANPPLNGDHVATFTAIVNPCTLAAADGSLFVDNYGGQLSKLDSSSGTKKYEISTGNTTVSVDPGSGHLYAAAGSKAIEYHAGAAAATVVSSTELAGSARGVAVSEGSGDVYVTRSGNEHVEAFGPLPEATHPFLEEFGSASQPTFTSAAGIAVDQSTGDVLVIDESAQTLNRFHADGTPDNFAELGGNVIDGHAGGADATPNGQILGNFGGANEVQVAIDNSGTATGGDIYVTDESHNIIDVFNSEGKYLGQLTAAGASAFGETCGVAVDEAGNVYVGDYNHGVHKFEPSANPPLNGDHVATFTAIVNPCTLAAADGSLFVDNYGGQLSKLDSSSGTKKYEISTGNTTVSVDPGSGHLYAAAGSKAIEYHAGAAAATVVSSTELAGSARGVAVSEGSGDVYVTRSGNEHVEVFGPPTYGVKLEVSKSGTGSGTVTSSPAGIDCGSECEAKFPEGTIVTLTASAAMHSIFTGWSGCTPLSGHPDECEVTMSEAHSVSATFKYDYYPLTVSKPGTGSGTVTSSPAWIVCGANCTAEVEEGTTIMLTASADAHSIFTGWTGCDSEPSPSECEVTMSEAHSVSATFTRAYLLTVGKPGTGSGTVTSSPAGIDCGASCKAEFAEGTAVTLIANPAMHSIFTGWSGCTPLSGHPDECEVTMSAAHSAHAEFALIRHTLTVHVVGQGSVEANVGAISNCTASGGVCTSPYVEGETVGLKATPAPGSAFAGWSGGCGGGGCEIAVGADTTLTATFAVTPTAPGSAGKPPATLAPGVVTVKGNTAAVELTCASDRPCAGVIELFASLPSAARHYRHRQRSDAVLIGKAPFRLAAGETKTIEVRITDHRARKLLQTRGKLLAHVRGIGVLPGEVKLRQASASSKSEESSARRGRGL